MSDLIDRDALLQDMTHRGGLGIGDWHIFDVINEQPSIDAQPVKHGEWQKRIKNGYGAFRCSECGLHFDYKFKFCPNCGADMRGGTDGV